MKKLLLACMLALNFGLSAQITVSESFETVPTPAGWTATNGTTTLTNVYSGASAGTSCQGTKHVFLNMYGSYPTWHHTYSSTFSNGEALDYSFSYLAKGWSTSGVVAGTVAADYSVDNGATWTEILAPVTLSSPNATPIPCATVTGTIPAGTIPTGANFKFRLKATRTGSGDFYMGFDNVQLTQVATTAPSCTTISAPANNATGISITPTITWAAAAGATSYDIAIGTTAGAADVLPLTNVTGTSYILPSANALNYSSTYFVTVYPKNSLGTATGCSSNSFTTRAIPCPTVTAPAANAKEVSLTPTITWDPVPGATGYKISVGTTANGTDILNNVDLGNVTQYVFATALLNSTRYYYTVNSYNAVSNSASCTNRVFDTVCQTFTSPYTQTFTGSVGPCWTFAAGGDTTNGPAGTSQMWYPDSFLNGPGSNNAVKINLYYQNNTGWLISPNFDLSAAGAYRMKFDYGLTDFGNTDPSVMGSDDQLAVLMSTDNGVTWTVIQNWTAASSSISNTSNQFVYAIAGNPSQVKFAFFGTDGSVDDTEDYDFFVDNFAVELIPTCLDPTAVVTSVISANSVEVNWTAPSTAPANGYQVYYSTVNTAPTATTVLDATNSVTSTSTTASIGGLTASTTYYIWVRSDCGTSQSPWAAGGSVYTGHCLPAPASVDGLGITNVTFGIGTNVVNNNSGAETGNYGNYSSMIGDIPSGIPATVSIKFETGYTYDTTIWVDLNNNLVFDAAEALYVGQSTNANPTVLTAEITIPVGTPVGNYRMRIGSQDVGPAVPCYTGTYGSYEDYTVNVLPAPSCLPPSALSASGITNNAATIGWTASSSAPSGNYDIYYSTTNTAPTASTVLDSSNSVTNAVSPVTISNLTSNTTYYVWVRANCSVSDQSLWAGSLMFKTLCDSATTFSQNFDSVTTPALPNCWAKVGASGLVYTQASTAMSGPNALYIYADSPTNQPVVSMPPVSTLQTGTYAIAFDGRANFTAGGIIEIGYLNTPGDPATFVSLGSYTASSTTTVDHVVLPITGVPAGVTILAFRHSGSVPNSVLLDNVQYDLLTTLGTTETIADVKSVKVYPNPFTDILHISDIKDVVSVTVTDMSGRTVRTIAKPSAQLQLGELNSGLYLVTLKYKDGSVKTVKAIKK